MAPIHKSVTLAHYIHICTKEKREKKKRLPKNALHKPRVLEIKISYFIIYYKLNCFKRRWMLQRRATSLYYSGQQY